MNFTLQYQGNHSEDHLLDLYDASQAVAGFQRSLAITSNLIFNGEVITQAPSLKNAQILSRPPEPGSWKVTAIVASSIFTLGTADKETPIGHLMHSAYDYVISESLGFHVDYEKSLGQQYDELKNSQQNELPIIKQSQLDSVIEKCELSVKEMHRPIVKSETAKEAIITYNSFGLERQIGNIFTPLSYEYMTNTRTSDDVVEIVVKVSSYNINTYRGRAYSLDSVRPIPFELSDSARDPLTIAKITNSLRANARERFSTDAELRFLVYENTSSNGRLKSYTVMSVI